jgi:hypothetical protein
MRPYAPALGLVGAAAGLALARRRRWTDTDVALYLDRRLHTEEAITTAVGLRNDAALDDPTRAVVVTTAATALADRGKSARPAIFRPIHALAPVALVATVLFIRAPIAPLPTVKAPPGAATVQRREVEGLKRVSELAKLPARDEAQRQRLERIAKDADKLRADLERGIERREAQDRLSRLRDAIAAERLTLGEGEQRAGLEAALSKLQENDVTREAAKALGDHDLERMDQEMERLANQREKRDRDLAKQKLTDAAEAARQAGAPDVAKALEDQVHQMEERARRADMLRELAKGLEGAGLESDELRTQSEALDRKGSDEAARKLADAMGKALEKLSPEERKRLADKLREQAKKGGGGAGDPQDLKDLADKLSTPEGQKELEQRLRDMAKEDTETEESKRQQGLDGAEDGAGEAERDLGEPGGGGKGQPGQGGQGGGGVPIPMPGGSSGGSKGAGNKGPGGDAQNGKGGTGGSHDTGTGDHKGQTAPLTSADAMRAKARGPVNRTHAMPGSHGGYAPGRAGGTARVQGAGGLEAARPGEVDGVDKSDVPEEYREQVRQYFQP